MDDDDIFERALDMTDNEMENSNLGSAVVDGAVVVSYISFPIWAHDLGQWAQLVMMLSGSALVIWRCTVGVRDYIKRVKHKRSEHHAHQHPRDKAGKFTSRNTHK